MQNIIINSYVKTTMAIANFKKNQQGVTSIEYAMIAAAIATAVAAAMVAFGPAIEAAFDALVLAITP